MSRTSADTNTSCASALLNSSKFNSVPGNCVQEGGRLRIAPERGVFLSIFHAVNRLAIPGELTTCGHVTLRGQLPGQLPRGCRSGPYGLRWVRC